MAWAFVDLLTLAFDPTATLAAVPPRLSTNMMCLHAHPNVTFFRIPHVTKQW